MSTTCEKEFTITVAEGDMPLNSAVYEPSRDRIYAVRDNWVFEMSATSGAKVSQHRFAQPGVASDTYIAYDSITDRLWATFWRDTSDINANRNAVKYLAKINPADITDVTLYGFTGVMSVGGSLLAWSHGPGPIITSGGIGWFLYTASDSGRARTARVNLLTPALTHTNTFTAPTATWTTFFHDGTSLLCGSNAVEDIQIKSAANLGGAGIHTGLAGIFPYGITSTAAGVVYWATATATVVKEGPSTIALGRPVANPHNIRYNSYDGLIYIPLYWDDTVAVLNPADDSFVIKTGFTNPWDCVFTPTKKFAVQHSSIGLKEIV